MRARFHLVTAAALVCAAPLVAPAILADQGGQGRGAPAPADAAQPARQGGAGQQGAGGGRGRQAAAGPARPAPRSANGRILLGGATPSEKGVWQPGGVPVAVANLDSIPLQPWARGVVLDRDVNELEPHTRCKPSGVTRPFLTPYGVEFVDLPDLQRIYIFDIGGPHTFRTIYMDGRTHPPNLTPTYYGHSIGWWEGDTLVVDTTGFNEGFWLDRLGTPHTERLRTLEKFTRTDQASIRYEVTLEDPGAYTRPWTTGFNLRWEPGTELFEYVCQQANYAHELMLGAHQAVSRATITVP
jgi:hypothetical protein